MKGNGSRGTKLPYPRFAQYFRYGAVDTLPGNTVLYTSDINGQFNIWTQSFSGEVRPGYQRMLTAFYNRTVREFVVSPDGRRLYFIADREGNEQYQIYTLPVSGGEPVAVTDAEDTRHEINRGCIHPSGRLVAYCDNGRAKTDFDLVIRNMASGKENRPLEQGMLWANPIWDQTGRALTVEQFRSNTNTHSFVYRTGKQGLLEILPHEEDAVVDAVGWTADGMVLTASDIGSEFRHLSLFSPRNGKLTPVYRGKHDIEGVFYSPVTKEVLYSINNDGYSELYLGRPGSKFVRLRLPGRGHLYNTLSGMSTDRRRKTLAFVWAPDNSPPEIMVLDIARGKSAVLTESMAGGIPAGIPPPTLVRYSSADGRRIPAFYYRPVRPKIPFPVVLSIHGGPESQEKPGWGYEGLYQFLQHSGLGVFCPNIRGSNGYGKTYQKMIHRDWGGAELQDLRHAAEWLRNRKEVDGGRMAVFGGSFGGFATLSCVTRLPEYWKAGVDICGPSNLLTFCRSVPPFWQRFMKEWVGDADTEADFLMERSPITYIDRTRADMLIIQGANDPRVVKAESDQMVERLRNMGRDVQYIVFPDEGHGFTKVENARKGFGAAADFLVAKLKG